jgi:hypothetical protein
MSCGNSDRIRATFLDISPDGAKIQASPTLTQGPPGFRARIENTPTETRYAELSWSCKLKAGFEGAKADGKKRIPGQRQLKVPPKNVVTSHQL